MRSQPKLRLVSQPHGKTLPSALDAERVVLGYVLARGGLFAVADVTVDDFFAESHRTIWAAILEAAARGDDTTSAVVAAILEERGKPQARELAALHTQGLDTRPAYVEPAAKLVMRKAWLRRFVVALQTHASAAYGELDGGEEAFIGRALDEFETIRREGFRRMAKPHTAQDVAAETAESVAKGDREPCTATGLETLDEALSGGMYPGELTLLSGPTGRGKSALASCVVANVACRGQGVYVAQLEDTRKAFMRRLACAYGRVPAEDARRNQLSHDDRTKLLGTLSMFARMPLLIDDTKDTTPQTLRASVERAAQTFERNGTPLGLVVVDYLQLVDGRDVAEHHANRERQVAEVARRLLWMAEQMKVPVLVLAQLNEQGEIRESKAALHHAQCWWDLKRDPPKKGELRIGEGQSSRIEIRKQRHGRGGATAPLWFHPQYVLFSDQERV